MPVISSTSCYERVRTYAGNNTGSQECHATAEGILDLLGVGATTSGEGWQSLWQSLTVPLSAAVYRVDLTLSDTDDFAFEAWGHSFAIVKVGLQMNVYQAYEGRYNLKKWLDGEAPGVATRFAPRAAGQTPWDADMLDWIATLRDEVVAGCVNRNVDRFVAGAVAIFGAPAARSRVVFATAKHFRLRWRRRELD